MAVASSTEICAGHTSGGPGPSRGDICGRLGHGARAVRLGPRPLAPRGAAEA
jgi:hypothetical protein